MENYILSTSHPDGRTKARFFRSLGFNAQSLHTALLQILENEVSATVESNFGIKYIVDGEIQSPINKDAWIRTIWIIETNESAPRFKTCYPRQGGFI